MRTCSLVHDNPFYNEIEIQAHMQKKFLHWSGLLFFSYSFTYKQNKETATCFLQEITHPTQSRQTFLAFFYYIWQVLHLHQWSSFQQLASCASVPVTQPHIRPWVCLSATWMHCPKEKSARQIPGSHLNKLSPGASPTWLLPAPSLRSPSLPEAISPKM